VVRRSLLAALTVVWLLLLVACGQEVSPPATPAPAATPAAGEQHAEEHGDEHEGVGLAKMRQAGCLACHRINGEGGEVGPALVGVYGTVRELTTGEKVVANDEYLHESIDDPNAKVVKGFPAGVMPSFEGTLSHQDIEDIVHYLKELQ
jgi:cytochrome c oxidase subunit 2